MGPGTQYLNGVPCWKSATRNIPWIALEGTTLAMVLVIVRIVNNPSFNTAGPPTEGGVTLCTVHLVATINFENNCSTLGTVARVLGEELGRLNTVRVARVRFVLVGALDLMTLRACPIVTHAALPRRTQKPATLWSRTRPNELSLLVVDVVAMEPNHQTLLPPLHVLNIYHDVADHLPLILTHFVPKNKSVELVHKTVLNRQGTEREALDLLPIAVKVLEFLALASYIRSYTTHLTLNLYIRLSSGHEALLALEEQ
jgi:hypothetical protein